MEKCRKGISERGSFYGGSNAKFNLIMCKYKMFISSTLQIYALNWYHKYLFHPVPDIMEETIHQYFLLVQFNKNHL